MTPHTSNPDLAKPIRTRTSSLAFFLAALAVILLASAPLGWRIGLLALKLSFLLLAGAGVLVVLAAILAALALIFHTSFLGWPRTVLLACIVLAGIALAGVGLHLRNGHAPPINDITTDIANPPAIVASLRARQAEDSVSELYGGPATAEQQKEAFPDIGPLTLPMPAQRAFELALNTASAMPGWHIVAVDPQAGRIEATQSSFWFGFVDDIVIRVAAEGSGSRVDMRSHSRHGRGDLGVNAERIRRYMAALRSAL